MMERNGSALKLNLPTTPVHDLVVKDNDLVVATHGRAFWILDDVSPLRQFNDDVIKKDVHLYTPDAAYRIQAGESEEHHPSKRTGQNPPAGAVIYYYLKDAPKAGTETKLEILDASGKVIRQYSSAEAEPLDEPLGSGRQEAGKGNKARRRPEPFRLGPSLRRSAARSRLLSLGIQRRREGPVAAPGQYQVRLTVGAETQVAPLELKLDPRVKVTQADLEQQFKMLSQIHEELNRVYDAVNQIQDVRSQVAGLKRRLPENASTKTISVGRRAGEKAGRRAGSDGESHYQRERRFAGLSAADRCKTGLSRNGRKQRGFGAYRGGSKSNSRN